MADEDDHLPANRSSTSDVEAFLGDMKKDPHTVRRRRGARLLFAMDATASREPTWDMAANLQHELFEATRDIGRLAVQLAFFRGFGEFKVSGWVSDAHEIHRLMSSVHCLAGQTQIDKVLKHARNQATQSGIRAVVYVGDCCEEDIDQVGATAGELGILGVPVFVFHEGFEPGAERAFRHIAKLSGGAYAHFDASSPDLLKKLLGAVAVFAAGGRGAFERYAAVQGGALLKIADQMRGRG